ncbi:hypothetical protein E0Z10_g3308 [Xylaria hypoxylon]|uniref:Protein kinase domain-containing protein n=1 Tax=Xylaria hypoxylon TaxID=37992 RepID=A0A4Z0ZA47_9PEZI|nr:hypothetical protein E0Z10_g3308 [Xylaria hypoxylon]
MASRNELRHEFENVAGQGGSGIALCFRDKQAGPDEFSRFIIKTVPLGDRKEIANETKWLRRLQWAEHIVTPLKLDPGPLAIPRREGGRLIFFGRSYFFIEYLENGTLDALLFKRRAAGLGRLPNRILWSIFLCPMAYPPFRIRNRRGPKHKSRELLPSPFYDPGNLVHTDMNLGNLMFGEVGEPPPEEPPLAAEHHLVPIVKLIDFGDAMEVKTPEILPARRTYDEELRLEEIMEDDVNKLENIGKSSKDGRELFRNVATDMNILEIGVVMGRLVTNDLTNPRAGVLRELMVELRDNLLAAWHGVWRAVPIFAHPSRSS